MMFVECDTCRAKPGTPQLCRGCLSNRDTIENALERQQRIADALADARNKLNTLNDQAAAWRHNYRTVLKTLQDENNALRIVAANQSADIQRTREILKIKWWQLWR